LDSVVQTEPGALGGDGIGRHEQSQRRPSREGLEAHPCGGFFLALRRFRGPGRRDRRYEQPACHPARSRRIHRARPRRCR